MDIEKVPLFGRVQIDRDPESCNRRLPPANNIYRPRLRIEPPQLVSPVLRLPFLDKKRS